MALFRILAAVRNSMVSVINTAMNAGSGAAVIEFYAGSMPANADAGLGGATLLGTLTCTDPAAPAPSGGTLTLSAITEDSIADASGTCTFVRCKDSAGTTVWDADASATGGGGTVQMNTVAVVAGGPIRISSATIQIPA